MKNLFLFLLLTGMTAIISCKGEQGDPGPAGVMGNDGRNGTDGTNGVNGNANVKSFTTDITFSNWVSSSSYVATISLDVPIITDDIANNGMVMVYWKESGETNWKALPYSVAYSSYTEAFSFLIETGKVTLRDISNDGQPIKPTATVRVVVATSSGLARNPDLDWTDYVAVSKVLAQAE